MVPVQVEAQPVVTGMTSSAYPLQPMSMCAYYIYIYINRVPIYLFI